MNSIPKIAVIIVTYNAMKWAKKCFTSLQTSTIPVEVIVVDNGSTDGTQEYIQTHFPEVEFIQSEENLGFGKANNIGIEKAYKNRADLFYLMNQDAWIYEDTFKKLIETYNNYPNKEEIAIISPIHLDGTEKQIEIFIEKYLSINAVFQRIFTDLILNKKNSKPYYIIDFVNAAHWLLPKKTIEKIGGFNPYFFHYGEDNEYVNRCHYHKLKILLSTQSFAVHDAVQNLQKVNYKKYRNTNIDTKLINPSLQFNLQQEIKSYVQSAIKQLFTFQFSELKKSIQEIKYLSSQKKNFIQIRETVIREQPSFLKLENHE